jgi:hypothetical protein
VPERRSIAELLVRLRLEPSVFDVVVEGPSDLALLDWFLRQVGCAANTRVFTVDEIEVGAECFRPETDPGNRDRVIRLSQIVHERADTPAPLLCVADRDLDLLLNAAPENEYLLLTDHAGMESLYFDEEVLDRFLSLYVRRRVVEPEALLAAMGPALYEVFLIRCADRVLDLGLGALSPERCCVVGDAALVTFDRDDYVTRYLMRGAIGRRDEFEAVVSSLRARGDQRGVMFHGKDFVGLLCHVLRTLVGNPALARPDVVQRALTLCLDATRLRTTPFFSALLKRLRCG